MSRGKLGKSSIEELAVLSALEVVERYLGSVVRAGIDREQDRAAARQHDRVPVTLLLLARRQRLRDTAVR